MDIIYMTKLDTDGKAGTRQAGAEIEITPEMIEAGLAALWPVEVPEWEAPAAVVERVYRGMAKALDPAR